MLLSETDALASGYKLYDFTSLATGTSTTLTFADTNDAGYFDLDSVSVVGTSTAVTPEPSSLILAATGLLSAVGMVRRRRMV